MILDEHELRWRRFESNNARYDPEEDMAEEKVRQAMQTG